MYVTVRPSKYENMYLQDILVHVLHAYFIGQVVKRFIRQNLMGFENCNVLTGTSWILDSRNIPEGHLIFIVCI